MSSVWRPIVNPPVLPKLHLSEEGQILFNYISRLYHRPVTTNFQSQSNAIKDDDEIWFFAKPSDKFEDSFTHQNNLNCKEIKIESKFIGENEDSYPGDNVHNFNSIHCDDASVKSFKWNVPVKRKQTFQETESFPYSKKSYSQILPMDNKISEHHFSTGETHKIAHTSQKTFPLTQTSNSQIYNKISGRGSSSQFN